jgi:hypothetical protein
MDKFLEHIETQRARLRKQMARLQSDLDKLEFSEKLYRDSGAAAEAKPAARPQSPEMHNLNRVLQGLSNTMQTILQGTIKDRVLATLGQVPDGLTSSQLVDRLRQTGLPTLERESLSPQLSRLRKEEKIDLLNGVWSLKKHESQGE